MISIIIPVYKAEKTLEDTVRSALAQQTETEIILIDDGSPDGCPALCDELAAAYGNIRVIHQKNGGICRARNAGIEAAEGEWLLFLDADDQLTDGAAAYMLATAAAAGAQLVAGSFDDLRHPSGSQPEEKLTVCRGSETIDAFYRNIGNCYGSPVWSKLFHRSIVGRFLNELRYGEDVLFNQEAFARAGCAVITNRRLLLYRRGDRGSATNIYFRGKHRSYVDSYLKMNENAEKQGASSAQRAELRRHFIRTILNCMLALYISGLTAAEKRAEYRRIAGDPDVTRAVRAWQPAGAKERLMKWALAGPRVGTLMLLSRLESGRQGM